MACTCTPLSIHHECMRPRQMSSVVHTVDLRFTTHDSTVALHASQPMACMRFNKR